MKESMLGSVRHAFVRVAAPVCVLSLSFFVGCGGDSGAGPGGGGGQKSAVDQGWDNFESGDYAAAAASFQTALGDDPTDSAAHNGLGWANLKLDNLQQALTSFDAAITNGFAGADPYAGKAIILRDTQPADYPGAIDAANAALTAESGFEFDHDAALDWKDLRLVLAQSYFALGQYASANGEVTALGGTTQDPQSPTFVDDLLVEIERLGGLIGG